MTIRSGITTSGSLRGIVGAARLPRDLRRLAAHVERLTGRPVRMEIAFVSDAEIGRLNREWLGHRGPTDVISFPLPESEGVRGAGPLPLLGALAVSRETARREAVSRGHAAYHELLLYVVHGVLHLAGHDDRTARQRSRMRRAERTALAALGLPAVYERRPAGAREAS